MNDTNITPEELDELETFFKRAGCKCMIRDLKDLKKAIEDKNGST